jgi:hypothetical protein
MHSNALIEKSYRKKSRTSLCKNEQRGGKMEGRLAGRGIEWDLRTRGSKVIHQIFVCHIWFVVNTSRLSAYSIQKMHPYPHAFFLLPLCGKFSSILRVDHISWFLHPQLTAYTSCARAQSPPMCPLYLEAVTKTAKKVDQPQRR